MARLPIALLVLVALVAARTVASEPTFHARFDRVVADYQINRDLTYTEIETIDTSLHTARAVNRLDRTARTFYPDKQTLEVVEAWVDQPDGTRVPVETGSIFTRPSAASRSAPGFVDSRTTTVLFPRLRQGSRTHVVWRFVQKSPALLGFSVTNQNIFDWETGHDETRISIPADIPLQWRARGGFVVNEKVVDGVRHISAFIDGTHGREDEPASVDHADFLPRFMATTLPNPEAIGAIIYHASEGRAAVTPEIAALASRIAGDHTGLDAARAIHAWVVAAIRYVAVWLSPDDGYVPHEAAEILQAGYGDCKDYVTLMRALLAARGIDAQMAVLDAGARYADPLLWSPEFANHAILYLPAYDRYVDPTNRLAGFDTLGRHLAGKFVVLVSKDGGVARTPAATPEANRYRYTARLTLSADGAIDGTAHYAMTPNMEVGVRYELAGASSPGDLAQHRLSYTPEGGFGEFVSSNPTDLSRPLELSATWHSPMAVNVQGQDTFLRVPTGLDMYPPTRERAKLSSAGKRETPVVADIEDSGWDTTLVLPPGMTAASLPPDIDLETPVGRYTARYQQDSGAIIVRRNLVIARQVVAPDSYPDLEKLIYAALVDGRATIVLTHPAQ